MIDNKKASQSALRKLFPNTDEGMAQLLHAQLYMRYPDLYVYYLKDSVRKFLPNHENLKRPESAEHDVVDDLIKTLIRYNNRKIPSLETNAYHAKVLRMTDTEQLFQLKENLDLGTLPKTVIPYEKARDAIINNPDRLVLLDCPCRNAHGEGGCYPRDVCIIVGEPWVSWVLAHNQESHPRSITQEEALEITKKCHEAGNVQSAFFKDAAANRLFALCNCCSCCCCGISSQNYLKMQMFAGSGYFPEIDTDKCKTCGICVKQCNFMALEIKDGKVLVDTEKCMGCEACITSCNCDAIQMVAGDLSVAEPLDIGLLIERLGSTDA